MIRMYRQTAEQMLLLLIYEMEFNGASFLDIATRLRNYQTGEVNSQVVVNTAKKGITGANMKESKELLIKQLTEDYSVRGEKDLIDQIVQTLQLPYGRNALSGETMRRLRQALLLPSEMGGLLHRLRAREMSCGQCGNPLHDRESVTYVRTGEGEFVFTCHRCAPPLTVSCAACDGTSPLSQKATTAMSKMLCPICQSKRAAGEKVAPLTPDSAPLPEELMPPTSAPQVDWATTFRTARPGRATGRILNENSLPTPTPFNSRVNE